VTLRKRDVTTELDILKCVRFAKRSVAGYRALFLTPCYLTDADMKQTRPLY